MKTRACGALVALVVLAPLTTTEAAVTAVDCSKRGSINAAIGKFDRSLSNVVNVSGNCSENVVVNGHRDLTINAVGTATIAPADSTRATVRIEGSSRVTLQNVAPGGQGLAIQGGTVGVECDDRSVCVLRNIAINGGEFGGLTLQKQSSGDVLGGSIVGSQGQGIGVYGASSVNVRSDVPGTPVLISGHANADGAGMGLQAVDGSFARVDGVNISNNDMGVQVDRQAVAKVLGSNVTGNGVGIVVRASSVQVSGNITNNAAQGIWVRRLGFVAFQGTTDVRNNGAGSFSIECEGATSTTQPRFFTSGQVDTTNCPNPNP